MCVGELLLVVAAAAAVVVVVASAAVTVTGVAAVVFLINCYPAWFPCLGDSCGVLLFGKVIYLMILDGTLSKRAPLGSSDRHCACNGIVY
jgi:hypothetical protein